MNAYTAKDFFRFWVDVCNQPQHSEKLSEDWDNYPMFTAHMLTEDPPVIKTVAKQMGLTHYCGYYSIDAVLYKDPEDRVPEAPPGTTWLRRIRVAFEHENYFNSGLFQETSHLLITDCDLRVLVSYPGSPSDLDFQLAYLSKIIRGNDRSSQISERSSFLFIVHSGSPRSLEWQPYVYEKDGFRLEKS